MEQGWDHAGTFAGVDHELCPLVRMTCPPAPQRMTPEAFPPGRSAFRGRVLVFGLLPVEHDDFTLVELEPGRGFHEASRLRTLGECRHRRSVRAAEAGCVVRDEIEFVPRWRGTGWLLARIYRRVSRGGTADRCDCSDRPVHVPSWNRVLQQATPA